MRRSARQLTGAGRIVMSVTAERCEGCAAAEPRTPLDGVWLCDRCADRRVAVFTGYPELPDPLSPATLNDHEGVTLREHVFVNVLSPSCSSWRRDARAVAARGAGYSAVTSVTAARAEDSSTIAFDSAKAATRD
jgi:hypothetical protein